MKLPPNTGGGDFEPPPAGTHKAVCFRVIDLGTQQTNYQGQTKTQRKIMLSWELPDERMPAHGDFGEQPFTIHQRYTFSSHEKAVLRQHLESWRGAPFKDSDFGEGGFDIKNVLGKGCLLSIVHELKDGKTYANLKGVAKLPKGMTTTAPENHAIYFSLDAKPFDRDTFEKLSENLRGTIMKSPEYHDAIRPANESRSSEPPPVMDEQAYGGRPDPDDAIPF